MSNGNIKTYHRNLRRIRTWPDGSRDITPLNNVEMSNETIVSDDVLLPYRPKSVRHTHWVFFPLRYTYDRMDRVGGKYLLTWSLEDCNLITQKSSIINLMNEYIGDTRYSVDWDAVKENAMPNLRNQFNTLNFLAEADDLPKMAKSLVGKAQYLQKLIRKREEVAKLLAKKRRLIGDLATLSADQVLEYNLGIAPTIGDAQTLYENLGAPIHRATEDLKLIHDDMLKHIRARQKKIDFAKRNAARGVRGHDLLLLSSDSTALGPFGPGHTRALNYDIVCRFSAEVRANAHFTGRYATQNFLSNLLDSAGIYPDLGTLWNALPFTFLIDYVFPFGKYLEKSYGSWSWADIFNGGSNAVSVSRATISTKFLCSFRVRGVNPLNAEPKGTYDLIWKEYYTGTGEYNVYDRFVWDTPELDGIDVEHEVSGKSERRRWLNAASLATGPVVAAARRRKML